MKRLIAISLLAMLVLLVGCAKPECEVNSDCKAANSCFTARCADGACVSTPKPNCCGNLKCEPAAGENECTCKDCGSCEAKGKVKYNITTTRGIKTLETKYARYVCNDFKECVISAAESDIRIEDLTTAVDELGFFRTELLSTFPNPFNIDIDTFKMRVRLLDTNPDRVSGGITFTNVQVLSGNSVMGEKQLSNQLNAPGESFEIELELTSSQPTVEEERQLSVKFDYEYQAIERTEIVTKRSSKKVVVAAAKYMIIKP